MMRFLLEVFILASLQAFVGGVEYGPSLSSLTGVFVNWKGPDILSIESGQKVLLERYPGFSATLPLISGESVATSEQIFKERGISTVGEFEVVAPKGFGLVVVIQELKLRKTVRDRGNPSANVSCSDYLQVGDIRSERGSSMAPEKICGTVVRDDLSLKPKGLLGPRTYQSSSGRVKVTFNHAYVNELVQSLLGSKQKHFLKAELTFTSYKTTCSLLTEASSNTTTLQTVEEESFEICSDYKFPTCISSKLLCDEIYNCGGDGETLGSDDNANACPDKPVRTTETGPQDDPEEKRDGSQDGLSNLATYLGISSLTPYTTKKYERKFRPSYISGSSGLSAGSGFVYDYSVKRTTAVPTSTTEPSPGGSIEIQHVVGPTPTRETSKILISSQNSHEDSQVNLENEIYSRRELSHAINSVIYGVAVFIIFTIFITVFIVCLTKKIQVAWNARSERRESRHSAHVGFESEVNRRRVSAPGILPGFTTLVIPSVSSRRSSHCDPGVSSILSVDPIPVVMNDDTEPGDLPPDYNSLFPTRT